MKYLALSLLHPKIVRGGCQQVAYELFEGASADDDVEAFYIGAIDPQLPNAHVPPGAVFTGVDGQSNESLLISYDFDTLNHLQTNWFVMEKVHEHFTQHRYDWIHFHHSLLVGLDVLEMVRRLQPEAKIFYTLHEYLPICLANGQLKKTYNDALCYEASPSACFKCYPDRSIDFFFLRKQLFMGKFALVDHFITPSQFTRDRFIDWGIAPERISVIPNGQKNLNAQRKPPKLRSKEKGEVTRFGFFGQMIDNKGAHLIVEAAELLSRMQQADEQDAAPFEVHFYGGNLQFASEGYRKRIEAAMRQSKDENSKTLFFHGEYVHEQLPEIMRSMDCVITPSTWSEVFGLVVSEAWMFHVPVIVSDIGGLTERVADGVNGLKFRPNDVQDLARAMHRFIQEYALKGKRFKGIKPPMSQEEFWLRHKALFQRTGGQATEPQSKKQLEATA